MGLLVVTGEEEGGASSDFRLLAGLLANLGGRRVENYLQVENVIPIAVKPGRTPIVFDVKEAQERRLVGESLTSVRERLRQVTNRIHISPASSL